MPQALSVFVQCTVTFHRIIRVPFLFLLIFMHNTINIYCFYAFFNETICVASIQFLLTVALQLDTFSSMLIKVYPLLWGPAQFLGNGKRAINEWTLGWQGDEPTHSLPSFTIPTRRYFIHAALVPCSLATACSCWIVINEEFIPCEFNWTTTTFVFVFS